MLDWIELVLGEDEEETEDEERPALDGAAEVRRPAPPGGDGAERPKLEAESEKPPERWLADNSPEVPGRTDWAGLRTDGTDWMKRAAEAGLETERPEWARMAEGPVRETGGDLGAGVEPAGEGLPEPVLKPDRGGSAALAELYRGAAEGARVPAPALAPERAARTAVEREAGGAPPLTVEELDRAVRRDSRRYDGGMSIF